MNYFIHNNCDILNYGDIMSDFERKMKEKIKQYSEEKYLENYTKKEFSINEGGADLYLNLNSLDDLFDTRTMDNQIDLNPEVYEFIEKKTSLLNSEIPINFHIVGAKLDSEEQEMIRHLLREHYAIELYLVQKRFNRCKKKITNLILIGLLSFLSYVYINLFTDLTIFVEIFGFLFSFALWEGFDSLIYYYSDIKNERRDITQNLLINVEFD